ncbi:unnamed protein product, partial [Rotaria sordida]
FADAKQKVEDPVARYFTESNLYKFGSFLALPITLPLDLTYTTMKSYYLILFSTKLMDSVLSHTKVCTYYCLLI